jgi:hypothetical protein
MDRILQRLLNQLLGKLMNKAINSGINMMSRRGKSPEDMTDQDHQQSAQTRDLVQKARKVQRVGRKLF